MKRECYKVTVSLDDETNQRANLLCELNHITFDELMRRLLNQAHNNMVATLEKEGVGL